MIFPVLRHDWKQNLKNRIKVSEVCNNKKKRYNNIDKRKEKLADKNNFAASLGTKKKERKGKWGGSRRGPERSVIDAKINPTSASPSLPPSTIINHLSDYDGSRRNILHPPPSPYIAGATNFWSGQRYLHVIVRHRKWFSCRGTRLAARVATVQTR